MGDITWEYAVFGCYRNISLFRKKNYSDSRFYWDWTLQYGAIVVVILSLLVVVVLVSVEGVYNSSGSCNSSSSNSCNNSIICC